MKSFNEIYQNVYKESAEPLEEMRRKTKNEIIFVQIFAIIIGIILMLLTKQILFVFLAIVIAVIYSGCSRNHRQYTTMFKNDIIKKFIKEYNENLEYEPNSGIDRLTYNKGEFESYDLFHSEDLITGTLEDGCKIRMSEVKTEDETTDSEGNTETNTVFHGLFAEVKLQKLIYTDMKVRKNSISIFNKKDKIEMDSSQFEKIFNVYSTDKIIAMQLLTSDVMQMLIEFKEKYKITPEFTITGNNLYIRFATGGVFEAQILKKALDYDTLFKYYNIINFTLGLTEKILKNIKETDI